MSNESLIVLAKALLAACLVVIAGTFLLLRAVCGAVAGLGRK
jgi:hypothetical protein